MPITEALVREIHKRLVAGVRGGQATPGQYRLVQNFVVNSATGKTIYTPPPAPDIPPLMKELVTWINQAESIHPVLVSGVAQFQLVHIHPFVDGNGRTLRLLSTLCLYRAGYDFKRLFTISEFYDRGRSAFYAAIQGVRDNGMDLTGWLEFFVSGLATQLSEVKRRGEVAIQRDVIVRQHGLSERQALALAHMMEHGTMTIQDFEALCPGVNRRTLQRDLERLKAKGLIVSGGATNRLQYYLRPEGRP